MGLDTETVIMFFSSSGNARCCFNKNCRHTITIFIFIYGNAINKQSGKARFLYINFQYADTDSVRILLLQE